MGRFALILSGLAMTDMQHIPVLLAETIELLVNDKSGIYLDATGGLGGHSAEILKRLETDGQLFISDTDATQVALLKQKFEHDPRCRVIHSRFSQLNENLPQELKGKLSGILADFGFASNQVDEPTRGITFQVDGPLDMRLDQRREQTAADLVNTLPEEELANLFFTLGEERGSRKIARAICFDRNAKPFRTTADLSGLAERVLGRYYRGQKIHPATRIFQALRMAVNFELEEIDAILKLAGAWIASSGRIALISFHSLEDRKVKQQFLEWKRAGWTVLTKKPVTAGDEELQKNPRSRSAKLRVVENGHF